MKAAMKRRFNALAEAGCVVCRNEGLGETPASIHHLIGIGYRGMGRKSSDEHTIPLCHHHHQGAQGIHSLGQHAWEARFGLQSELLAQVNEDIEWTC